MPHLNIFILVLTWKRPVMVDRRRWNNGWYEIIYKCKVPYECLKTPTPVYMLMFLSICKLKYLLYYCKSNDGLPFWDRNHESSSILYSGLHCWLFYWTWVCSDQSASIKRYPVVSPFDYITSTTEYNTKQYNRLFMLRNQGWNWF